MTPDFPPIDPWRLKEFVLTEADVEVMLEQQAEYLRLPKRTRVKYARNLRAALLDLDHERPVQISKEDHETKSRNSRDVRMIGRSSNASWSVSPASALASAPAPSTNMPIRQQQPIDPQTAMVGVGVGLILTPIGMAMFMGLIWVIQQAVRWAAWHAS